MVSPIFLSKILYCKIRPFIRTSSPESWNVNSKEYTHTQLDTPDFLTGCGEMGERIRAFDWSSTPLGPMSNWSPALRIMLRILLANFTC